MNSIYHIPVAQLCLLLIPAVIVLAIYWRWSLRPFSLVYAGVRMVLQLVLIGFALRFIFENKHPGSSSAILAVMLLAAGWIALRPVGRSRDLLLKAYLSITVAGLLVLAIVIFGVVRLKPWYDPRYLIPLAGMIFAQSMNCVSLAADRFLAERKRNVPFNDARGISMQASLIPITNSFLAVGLVSLPGMMTGQILAGISPLIAVRYQIMVMLMLLSAGGMASAVFLTLLKEKKDGV